jgi:hypothetical protein
VVATPQINYTTAADGVDIAWQEFGTPLGPRLFFVPGFVSHLELNWESPTLGTACRSLRPSALPADHFDDRGSHELKGVPDHWQIYAAR